MFVSKRWASDREWMEAAGRITCEAINSLERECIAPVDYEAHYVEFIEYAAVDLFHVESPEFAALVIECNGRVARDIESKAAHSAKVATLMADPVSKAIVEAVVERLVNRRGIRPEVALEGAQAWFTREMAADFVSAAFGLVCDNEGW